MVEAAISGDFAEAQRLQNALAPILGIITVKVDNQRILPNGDKVIVNDRYRNPLAIKTLMAGLGMPSMPCRKPLGKMSRRLVWQLYENAAKRTWESNPEILQPISDFYGVDIYERINDDSIWLDLAN